MCKPPVYPIFGKGIREDLNRAIQEVSRCMAMGRFVIFTSTPEQMQQYWLWEYFPQMMKKGSNIMKRYDELEKTLKKSGFLNVYQEKYNVTKSLKDHFLHAGKYTPEIYLNPDIRAGISSFHAVEYLDEINLGLSKLKEDIDSGRIQSVIDQYESDVGDYCFIVGEK